MSAHASSGDLLADRRYAWAMGAFAEQDFEAAADLLRQTIEAAPNWAPAHAMLGDALAKMGANADAAEAYMQAAALDPAGVLGAGLKRAALGADSAPASAPAAYVRALFDEYAPRFEAHLREKLAYRGPEILMEALARACAAQGRALRFARALDLGCGSGLMAHPLRACSDHIAGVDLSPAMVELSRRSGLYDRAETGDVEAFLAQEPPASCDLVIAADVFVYIGDLAPVFAAAARALSAGGLFAFTVQKGAGAEWALGADLRYAHTRGYLQRLAAENGFQATLIEDASTRRDAGADVPGLVAVFVRT